MDVAFGSPYYWTTVPQPERTQRTELTSDLCSIDNEDFFIRGILLVPIRGTDEHFGWGLWTSVSKANFDRYRETFDSHEQSALGTFTGYISNQIDAYPNLLQLVVRAHLQDDNQRPKLELEPTDHPLAVDQREGISQDRVVQLVTPYLHPANQT